MGKRKMKLQKGQTRAAFVPETFNAERNTMDVVWSTGARVKRSSWYGDVFYEELSMKKSAVNLERMNKGAPLLNNHGSQYQGLRDIMGKVVEGSAKIVKGEGRATVKFSKRAEIADLIGDIKDGIIPNISVGYRIDKMQELEEKAEDGSPIMRAESWEPLEISFVTIPADMHAQARSLDQGESHEVTITRKEGDTVMAKKKKPTVAKRSPGHPVHTDKGDDSDTSLVTDDSGAEDEADDLEGVDDEVDETSDDLEGVEDESAEGDEDLEADEDLEEETEEEDEEETDDAPAASKKAPAKKAAAKKSSKKKGGRRAAPTADQVRAEETQRHTDIRKQVRLAGLDEAFADGLTGDVRVTSAIAAKRIFAELEKRTSAPTMNQRIEGAGMKTELERRNAAVRGLLSRVDQSTLPEKYRLKQDGDQEFRQGSLLAMARHFLHVEGVRDAYTLTNNEVAMRSLHTTSDFANVLSDASNISLREGYQSIPSTYEQFTRKKNVASLRPVRSVEISNGGRLEKVNEHGEYRRTSLVESADSYVMEKFGIIIGKTWELIVNDDLDALTDMPAKLGKRARELENITFWNLIMSNPVMADGFQFFSAQHGNLGTAGVAGVTTIGEARAKQRVMKDLDGELIAGLSPDWIVNPAALETSIEQFLAPTTPAQSSQVNPFAGKLKQMTESLLDGSSTTAYYLFADKVKRAIAEMSLLDGKGPEIFTREGFNVDGYETKIRYVFGMGLVDWRGAFKNAGQ